MYIQFVSNLSIFNNTVLHTYLHGFIYKPGSTSYQQLPGPACCMSCISPLNGLMTSDFLWAHRPKRGLKTRLLLDFHCTFPDPKVNSWFVGRVLMRSRVSVGDYTLNSVASTLTTNQSTNFLLDFVAGCVLTIGEGPGETNCRIPSNSFSLQFFWDEVRSDLCLEYWRDTKDWMGLGLGREVFFGFQASSHSYFSWVADQDLDFFSMLQCHRVLSQGTSGSPDDIRKLTDRGYPEKSQPGIWGVRV